MDGRLNGGVGLREGRFVRRVLDGTRGWCTLQRCGTVAQSIYVWARAASTAVVDFKRRNEADFEDGGWRD